MRRLGRWMLNGLTLISLLLSVITVLFWLRPHLNLHFGPIDPFIDHGHLTLQRTDVIPAQPLHSWEHVVAGFGIFDYTYGPTFLYDWRSCIFRVRGVGAPAWFVLSLLLALPAWRGYRWFTTRPPDPGLCPHCSYDLTDNVSGVCPECGTPVAAKT